MASKTSGTSRSTGTLQDKIKQRHTHPISRPYAFPAVDEMKMKVYADSMDIGRGLWVSDLQNEGEKITKRNPVREHPFKDGKSCESIICFYSVAL